jgi:type IV secretion system protein VirD4
VAGYNMRLMLVMQSKAQLRDRDLYGPDKAAAILDNCGIEVVFGTKDLQLCKELSERLGYDTVEAHSRSGPLFWRIFRGGKANLTESDQRRALLLPQEIMRLKPREAIIVRPGMYPIKAKRIRYYKDRFFTQFLRKPPIVEPIEITVRMDEGKGFQQAAAAATEPPPPTPESARKSQARKGKAKKPVVPEESDAAGDAASGSGANSVRTNAGPRQARFMPPPAPHSRPRAYFYL